MPLRIREAVIGTRSVSRGSDVPAFTLNDQALLLELADRAAFAIQNARLFEAERLARAHAEGLKAKVDEARAVAEQAATAREDLMAIVSHDLRSPLAAIKTSAFMLNRIVMLNEGMTEEGARISRHADTIQRSATRMERLIRDLLDFSQIQAGAFTVKLSLTAVMRLLDDAADLQPLAMERGQELSVASVTSEICVSCESDRIAQVFSNLISNAVKFSPPGGKIELSVNVGEAAVEFSVQDSGPGIPCHELDQVFAKYWRHEKPDARAGFGLGLFIARGIVRAHGGELRATNALGGGARFYFSLPRV